MTQLLVKGEIQWPTDYLSLAGWKYQTQEAHLPAFIHRLSPIDHGKNILTI
ncbi:hypothetical protein [Sulfobacillus thermosulfidooxidans]|uniref:hypothetical protein n=1 Tax=Sulfobacillus thermosulfidooxidans TaxID=28034 RepID=UPI000AA328EE|nr:hypothetical protein [Sulfobacillus thermosulfidooxidans]